MGAFYRITSPRASKLHRCQECRTTIEKGVRYARHDFEEEGDVYSVAVCETCQALRSEAWDAFGQTWDEGPTFGELRNELRDEGVTDPDAWLAERRAMRQVLKDALDAQRVAAAIYQNALPGRTQSIR